MPTGPVIMHHDDRSGLIGGNLLVTWWHGTEWKSNIVDESAPNVGEWISTVVLPSGRLACAYSDSTNENLRFAISLTVNMADGFDTFDIESDISNRFAKAGTSIVAAVDGRPMVASFDEATYRLFFAISSSLDGRGDWIINPAIENTMGGRHPSLIVVSGFPAVAYVSNFNLKFARAQSVNGTEPWIVSEVDDNVSNEVGFFSNVVSTTSSLLIVHMDHTARNLKLARNSKPDGTGEWYNSIIYSDGDAGWFPSLAVSADGVPAVTFACLQQKRVWYGINSLHSGAGNWSFSMVDSGVESWGTSLKWYLGRPSIAYGYYDVVNEQNNKLFWTINQASDGLAKWQSLGETSVGVTKTTMLTPEYSQNDSSSFSSSSTSFAENSSSTNAVILSVSTVATFVLLASVFFFIVFRWCRRRTKIRSSTVGRRSRSQTGTLGTVDLACSARSRSRHRSRSSSKQLVHRQNTYGELNLVPESQERLSDHQYGNAPGNVGVYINQRWPDPEEQSHYFYDETQLKLKWECKNCENINLADCVECVACNFLKK